MRPSSDASLDLLLVEDNPGDVGLVESYLEAIEPPTTLRHETRLDDALEALFEWEPDVVLLDLGLPDAGAQETIEAIPTLKITSAVVVLTSGACPEVEFEALQAGADEFLNKNELDASLLARCIDHADERYRTNRELEMIQRAIDHADEGVVIADARREDMPMIYCNEGFAEMTGYSVQDVLGKNCRFMQCEETDPDTVADIREALEAEEPITTQILNETKEGERFWNELSITPIHDDTGRLKYYVGFQRDVTRRVEAEKRLRERRRELERYETIIESSPHAIAFKGLDGHYHLVNQRFANLMEQDRDRLEGFEVQEAHECARQRGVERTPLEPPEGDESLEIEEDIEVDGEPRTLLTIQIPYFGENDERIGTIQISRDVTERKQMHEQLAYEAQHDQLTGLPNRSLFAKRLEHLFKRISRRERVVIALIDLDNFKVINDSFGHFIGDVLLKRVASRLEQTMRSDDLIARFGGDEFVVLLESDAKGARELDSIGARLEQCFLPPFELAGDEVPMSASIGFAHVTHEDLEQWDLDEAREAITRAADRAMYTAKARAETSWESFDAVTHGERSERIQRENRIREGLERDEFVPYYQPIYSLSDGGVMAVEVLARWDRPERGIVPPKDFIPLASKSDLLCQLGRAVFETACRQFQARASSLPDDFVSELYVNLSPRQLRNSECLKRFCDIADEAAHHIEISFEVTESQLLEHLEPIVELRKSARSIVLDDFGTGFSSMKRLKAMPVDVVKLDMEFVQGATINEFDAVIVEKIGELGQRVDLNVVGEGVEDAEQLAFLDEAGFTAAQGFYLARPQPLDDLLDSPSGAREAEDDDREPSPSEYEQV